MESDNIDELVNGIADAIRPQFFSYGSVGVLEQERFKDIAAEKIHGFVHSAVERAEAKASGEPQRALQFEAARDDALRRLLAAEARVNGLNRYDLEQTYTGGYMRESKHGDYVRIDEVIDAIGVRVSESP